MSNPKNSPSIRSALATVYAAMRAGFGSSVSSPDESPDHGHDPRFLDEVAPLLDFLYTKYFRVRMLDLENIPETGAALLVANHSGGVPYDGAMLIHGIHREHPRHRRLRPLVANFAFRSPWMSQVVARIGGCSRRVRLCTPAAGRRRTGGRLPRRAARRWQTVPRALPAGAIWPRGFVRLAREAGVPIIPVAIVGAEEIHPVLAKVTAIAAPLGLPYIPITPTFPLLGPLGLLPVPTKWTIQFGEPIVVASNSEGDAAAIIADTAERVRGRIDALIADILSHRRSIIFG